jgi:thiopeptide-type bacteriocin biosynthesis protein
VPPAAGTAYSAGDGASIRVAARPISDYAAALRACPVRQGWEQRFAGYLVRQWRQPELADALLHAAPDLAAAAERHAGHLADHERTFTALARYVNRISTRPTPFGMLAGVAGAALGDACQAVLATPPLVAGDVRPDHAFASELQQFLRGETDSLHPGTVLGVNDLAVLTDRYVHLDAGLVNWRFDQPPTVLRLIGGVREALRAGAGKVSVVELCALLRARWPELTETRVRDLLAGLCGKGFLAPAPFPRLAGTDDARLTSLLSLPGGAGPDRAVTAGLRAIDKALADEPGVRPAEATLRQLGSKVLPRRYAGPYVHIDAVARSSAPLTLPVPVKRLAEQAAEVLSAIGGAPYPAVLTAFADQFTERYGPLAEVPVLEALSQSLGIGPPEGYRRRPGSQRSPASADDSTADGERDKVPMRLIATSLATREVALRLDDATVAELACRGTDDGRPPAPTADMCLRIGQDPAGQWHATVLGASPAGALTGRFRHVFDDLTRKRIDEIVRLEGAVAPDYTFVELLYRPSDPRARNLVSQGTARRALLPVNVDADPAGAEILSLHDVVVGVQDRRLYFRHASGRLLAFSQASTIDYRHAPSVCRLLLEASFHQFRQVSAFDWGAAGNGPFTPRLALGNVVVTPASWSLGRPSLAGAADLTAFAARVAQYARDWMIPRFVYLTAGDQRLLLDLQSAPSLNELRSATRHGKGVLRLEEAVPLPGWEFVLDVHGRRYASEVVVPVALKRPLAGQSLAERRPARRCAPEIRRVLPGSGWLALHVYLARRHQDRLITAGLAELRACLEQRGAAADLFFVRYSDPRPHVRIRIRHVAQPDGDRTAGTVLAWAQRWREVVPIADLVITSYHREIERYGGPEMLSAAEPLFCADSRAVAQMLTAYRQITGLSRVGLAALSLGHLAGILVPDGREQVKLLRRLGDPRSGSEVFAASGDDLWRLANSHGPGSGLLALIDRYWTEPAAALRNSALDKGNGSWPESAAAVVPSLLHMHANRLGLLRSDEAAAVGVARRLASRTLQIGRPAEYCGVVSADE